MQIQYKKIFLWIFDLMANLVVIMILVFLIQKFIIAPFDINGSSMCDTLNIIDDQCEKGFGEKVIINEIGYIIKNPARGDIVVFKPNATTDKYFIKRIIGLPGETVEIKNGKIFITKNGEETVTELDEPYLNENNKDKTQAYFSGFSVFEVPEDHYFMLGDNRRASTDSRSCFGQELNITCKQTPQSAFVEKSLIRGKASLVWWPLQNIRLIKNPGILQVPNQEISQSLAEK